MENITNPNLKSHIEIIQQQNVLIEKLLTRVEQLKHRVSVVKKETQHFKSLCKSATNEAELYKNYCKNVKHIKWSD
jgi:cell shape-determining protein MreC